MLLPWQPVPQVPHLTHAALISPAIVPWLDSIMPAWAFQSSKQLGATPSKPGTTTPSMASPTPMQPGTVRMLTKRFLPPPIAMPSNQSFVATQLLSRLFTNNTGRFPARAHSDNQYVMIAFHADGNLILQQTFKTKSDCHCNAAYNTIMTCLVARGLSADLQILDNKASSAYKEAITFKWNATSSWSLQTCIAALVGFVGCQRCQF
jgi:hypothetical protein